MIRGKKAESKIISVYWFVILLLVATGIIVMVNVFYGSPYDIRRIEAEILSENIANCISPGGEINEDLLSPTEIFKEEFRDNFLSRCNVTLDAQSEFKDIQYYLEIEFTKKDSPKRVLFEIVEGNPNFKEDCNLDGTKHEKLVQCVQKEFYSMGEKGTLYSIKMTSMVRKTEQNAK